MNTTTTPRVTITDPAELLAGALRTAIFTHEFGEDAGVGPNDGVGLRWAQDSWGQVTPDDLDFDRSIEVRSTQYVPVTCGTTGCIAGTVVHLRGDDFVLDADSLDYDPDEDGLVSVSQCATADEGEVVHISDRACALMGLDFDERELLFNGSNTIYDVCWVGRRIAQRHGWTLDVPRLDHYCEEAESNPDLGYRTQSLISFDRLPER